MVGLDALLAPYDGEHPGIAVGVVREGRVIAQTAKGFADLDHKTVMSCDSNAYMSSTSKQFTAACALIARADGLLDFNQSIRQWIPQLPDWAEPVRIDDLLHHTSGLRDYQSFDALQGGRVQDWSTFDVDALLAQLQSQHRLGLEPGQRYDYSNTNYVLVAEIISRAAGQSFAEFAKSRLFMPLGMDATQFLAGAAPSWPTARAYAADGNGWREDDEILGVMGDGGLRSSVHDQLIWLKSLMDDELGLGLLAELGEVSVLANGVTTAYGRGLLRGHLHGQDFLAHGGTLNGWASHNVLFPDARLGVSVIACFSDAPVGIIARAAASQILGLSPDSEPASYPVPPEMYGRWIDPLDGIYIDVEHGNEDDQGSHAKVSGDLEGPLMTIDPSGTLLHAPTANAFHLLNDNLIERRWHGGHERVFERATPWIPKSLAAYAGIYRSEELDIALELRVDDGGLVVMREGDPFSYRANEEGRLHPISDERFGGVVALRFHRTGETVHGFTLDAFRARNFEFLR